MSLRIPSSPRGQRCCRPAETDRDHTCSLGVPGSLSYYISTSNHVSKKLPEVPKNIQSVTSGKSTYIIYMLCVVMTVVKHKTMKAGNVTVFNWATGKGRDNVTFGLGLKKGKKKILKFWFGSEIVPKCKSCKKNKTVTSPADANIWRK